MRDLQLALHKNVQTVCHMCLLENFLARREREKFDL
jgi:hypothetical protein